MQHCLEAFKLNKHAKCLSLNQYEQLINQHGWGETQAFQHEEASSLTFSAIIIFLGFLGKCDTDIVAFYHVASILLLTTLLYLSSYKQCCTQ